MPASLLPKASAFDPKAFAAAIDKEVASLAEGEFNLNKGYARLAGMLVRFKAAEVWRELGHSSFNSYLLSIQERFGRSAKQLYVYIGVAEYLLPTISEANLNLMGVTKAEALARASKKAGRAVTPELLSAALDGKIGVQEIKALAHQAYNLPAGELPKGTWQDFGGAFLTVEERKVFVDAVKVTTRVLGLGNDIPDWVKRKNIILAWAAEFSGTWAAEAYGEGMGANREQRAGDAPVPDEESSC